MSDSLGVEVVTTYDRSELILNADSTLTTKLVEEIRSR